MILPVVIGIFYVTLNGMNKASREFERLSKLVHSPIHTLIGESIDGASTIRTFKKVKDFESSYSELEDKAYVVRILNEGLRFWMCMRLNLISIIFVGFSYGYCIFSRDGQDTIMIGLMMGYLIELQWNIHGIIRHLNSFSSEIVSFERCIKMFSVVQEAEQRKDVPNDENGLPWISKGHVKFQNYSVRYRPETEVVLKNVNLDIQPGQKIGIVGRTGAGKSTLCLALCRIIEKLEGSITIDGIDISTVGISDLRDRITIIPQEPVLFKNTLRFNLDPENKCSDEELIEILTKSGLKDLLKRDSSGLNFKITDKGDNLSAGEKALVCISRAVLRKNRVVLMDEATASIDVNTEETIQKLIRQEFKDVTVITVAHRLNTILHSDKIAVMGEGTVLEFDTPSRLKANEKSAFYKLVNQFNC